MEKEVFNSQVAGHSDEEKNQEQDDFGEDANLKLDFNPNFVSWDGVSVMMRSMTSGEWCRRVVQFQ